MTNPNAVPRPWLLQFRDRFADRWATDCAWPSPWDSLIPYIISITTSLKIKVAESRLFHQETGEIPFSAQNPACSNCEHYRYVNLPDMPRIHSGSYHRTGTCTKAGWLANIRSPLGSSHAAPVYTHQDFWCVLHDPEEPDDE